jgi:hypothetical protein
VIKLGKQSLALIGTFIAVLQPAFTANSQESNSEFSKLQSLLEAKKWYEGVGRGFLDRLDSSIKNQKSQIDCRAGQTQTSTSESGGDFSLASTLQSKIKNQKSIDD